MAFHVSSDESFADPWNGRSTPTISVVPVPGALVLLPPPHPVAASAATASTPSALIRLFILILSLLLSPVRSVDRRARSGTGPSTAGIAARDTSTAGGP